MKKRIILIAFLITSLLFSQEIVFEKDYNQLPFDLRITNSGIYSIASFDVENNAVTFSSFTKEGIFKYEKKGTDFSFLNKKSFAKPVIENIFSASEINDKILIRKNYFNGFSAMRDKGGEISGKNGENITVAVPNRNKLIITSNIEGIKRKITFNFSANLACADLIGIDKNGNLFILVEKYLSDIPLKIERNVYTVAKNGELLSRLLLPDIKYLYTLKDLQIDSDGNLYNLLTYNDKAVIIKWGNLIAKNNSVIKYPDKYYRNKIDCNNYIPTDEITTKVSNNINSIQTAVSRTEALRIGESYALHQYQCKTENLATVDTKAPDGDIVRTPSWLVVGWNARIPYKWGGFNTVAQFDEGLASGKFAGDINTDGVSSYARGVDCSGFVSRCWQLSYHASTRYMPDITTQYSSWDDLKPGDAVHKIGHVRLFVGKNINGSLKIVEAAGRNWDVSYWSYKLSDLTAYTPRYYNKMETNYNSQIPELISAELKKNKMVLLKWNCNTTNIAGYRIYFSTNGKSWNKISDETECKTTSAEIAYSGGTAYYRVAGVKNDAPYFSESHWSNVLGVADYSSQKTALIVDGFERESGSWRAEGNPFAVKYGNALKRLSQNFISVKNSEIINGTFNLTDFDFVFWILGDESTVDETFSAAEQTLVKNYLANGGNLFVSGSEIGWDLDHKGNAADKEFYNKYLKAKYISDDASFPSVAKGVNGTALDGCNLNFGQTYEEDYPDEIGVQNGSTLCMKYLNGKGAGVQFIGNFENSEKYGGLIYLAFPLETTADDTDFNQVIKKSVAYYNSKPVAVNEKSTSLLTFTLNQNYPNPFNPSTTIEYSIPKVTNVSVTVYDILGKEVAILVNKRQTCGNYKIQFNASNLPTGIYLYKITAGGFVDIKKMLLVK